jgi:hypothetical protein
MRFLRILKVASLSSSIRTRFFFSELGRSNPSSGSDLFKLTRETPSAVIGAIIRAQQIEFALRVLSALDLAEMAVCRADGVAPAVADAGIRAVGQF